MRWFLRFLGCATVLAFLCWHGSEPYQRGLSIAASLVVALSGESVPIYKVQIYAPFDLGIFVAMCFASQKAPFRLRVRAAVFGLPVLAGLELTTVVLAIAVTLAGPAETYWGQLVWGLARYGPETNTWVGPAFMWLALLGSWEIRIGDRGLQPSQEPRHHPSRTIKRLSLGKVRR